MKKLLMSLILSGAFVTVLGFDGKVYDPGQKPDDLRLGEPVTLRDYHPFRREKAEANWEQRQEEIVTRIRLASGILPEPEKTPLNPVVSEPVAKDGFAIQKVYFESFPGHYVTGTLFTPHGESVQLGIEGGKRPVVLCPHGHWKNGRFYDAGETAAKKLIAQGAERFMTAARNPIHARCVQLARMGCIVFHYDMLGNADSVQFPEHRRGPRPEMNGAEDGTWGFVSPQSILRLQTNFGLQTWNSVRALDWILEHGEADPNRVLVTGASGGGTQTMILAAIDERVDASFPCVMPSTSMQGGCTCENSYYLRIGQGNMDITAATAPRPLGITAADDWTIELETKGHPDLVALYKQLKAPGNYEAHFDIHFKHNYNHVSRTHMYQFVNRHFGLGMTSPVLERDFAPLTIEDLTVWNADGSRPDNYLVEADHERDLNRVWAEDGDARLADARATGEFGDYVAGWKTILRRELSDIGDVEFELVEKEKHTGFTLLAGIIRHPSKGEEFPSLYYYPDAWNGTVTIMPTEKGKAGLYVGKPVTPTDEVRGKLDQGHAVVGVDLFGQGEFLDADEQGFNQAITYSGKAEVDPTSWQRSPVYFYGYNDSAFVRRVHDLLSTIKMVQTNPNWDVEKIGVSASGPMGAVVLAADLMSGEALNAVELDFAGFTFESINDSWSEHFVPGAVRLGDVGMLEILGGR